MAPANPSSTLGQLGANILAAVLKLQADLAAMTAERDKLQLQLSASPPEKIVYRDVPGPERIVYQNVPGPERIVYQNVPGPERIVYQVDRNALAPVVDSVNDSVRWFNNVETIDREARIMKENGFLRFQNVQSLLSHI